MIGVVKWLATFTAIGSGVVLFRRVRGKQAFHMQLFENFVTQTQRMGSYCADDLERRGLFHTSMATLGGLLAGIATGSKKGAQTGASLTNAATQTLDSSGVPQVCEDFQARLNALAR